MSTIRINDALEVLQRARGQALLAFKGEGKRVAEAINYLYEVVDTELQHWQKVEQGAADDFGGLPG